MALSLHPVNFSPCSAEMVLDMKAQLPIHSIRMGQLRGSGETLLDMARCLFIESSLPKLLWPDAVIRNRCYNRCGAQTPYYMLTGKKPDLSKIKIFGSVCYAEKVEQGKVGLSM